MAQIYLFHRLVGEDGLGVTFGNQLSIVDDVGGFADIQGFAHVVIGDQDADAWS